MGNLQGRLTDIERAAFIATIDDPTKNGLIVVTPTGATLSGGGGGGGAVTIADGADATLGSKADAKSTATDATPVTIMQVLKQISASLQAPSSTPVTNIGTFAVQASQSGVWTVQPGNTANTIPWLTQMYGIGRSTLQTNVSNGTANQVVTDRNGRIQTVKPNTTIVSSAATPITTNTNTSIVAAPSAGNHLKIYRIYAQNSSSTGTWLYWTEGSGGTKRVPWYLSQYQPGSMNLEGTWELPTATALFINTATTGANIEWMVEYETVVD